METSIFSEIKVTMIAVTTALIMIAVVGMGSGQLMKSTNDCTCPGDTVTYNCNVAGSGFTIWRGSAFDCPSVSSRILLRHSLFGTDSGAMGLCNDGAVVGRSIGITGSGSVYTSQLTINLTATSSVIGQTIECVYRNIESVETTIGHATIEIPASPPPPTIVQLVGISSEQLVFNWTSVDSNCSTLQYNVVSSCGTCASTTAVTTTSVICSIHLSSIADSMTQCSFGIQSTVCANISGNPSEPLGVTLKVPESPTISSIVAHYNEQGNKLIYLDVKFNAVERFMISDRVNGSALSYVISYNDSDTGDMCNSLTILAPSCKQGICTAPFISPLPCSERDGDGDIDIAISAINRLGRGPPSVTTIGQTNKYVNVTFELANKIKCTFLEDQSTASCDVSYGPCQQQPAVHTIARGKVTSSNVVNIAVNPQTNEYCYVVNASNGTFTVLIEGRTMTSTDFTTEQPINQLPNQSDQGLVVGVTFTVTFVIAIGAVILTIIVALVCIHRLRERDSQGSEKREPLLLEEHTPVNIRFDLVGKPKELMSVLQKLEKLQINIKNIKVDPSQSLVSVRTVYMECWNDLTEVEKQNIEALQIGVYGTLTVYCKAEVLSIKVRRDAKTTQRRFCIIEILEDQPGALLSLLKVVDSVEECQHINITNIEVQKLPNEGTQVIITFLPDMAEDWKEKYDKKREECKSILLKPPAANTETTPL